MIKFEKIVGVAEGLTLMDEDNLQTLYGAMQKIENIAGDVAEVGVYKGGSARFMMKGLPKKHFWLFDTFRGLPYADEQGHALGDFAADPDALPQLLNEKQYTLIPGLFPATIVENEELVDVDFSLVHLDVDCYQSTTDGLDYFWPKLSGGGIIMVHDYGWIDCPGVKKAVDSFIEQLEKGSYESSVVGSEGHTQYCMLKKL